MCLDKLGIYIKVLIKHVIIDKLRAIMRTYVQGHHNKDLFPASPFPESISFVPPLLHNRQCVLNSGLHSRETEF